MARVWSKPQKCKHCGLKIEYNTVTKKWQTWATGREHCAKSNNFIHAPKG